MHNLDETKDEKMKKKRKSTFLIDRPKKKNIYLFFLENFVRCY